MQKLVTLLLFALIVTSCGGSKANRIDDYVFKKKTEKAAYIKSYNNALTLWTVPFRA